jgi:hypothetical protein
VADIASMRRIVAKSSQLLTYEPKSAAEWHAPYERYRALCGIS